jgi:hypothetical protein
MTTDGVTHDRSVGARVLSRLLSDTRGAAATEYVILIAFVGVSTAAAIAGWLPRMAQENARQREVLSEPYP